jgi:hypothetical protein
MFSLVIVLRNPAANRFLRFSMRLPVNAAAVLTSTDFQFAGDVAEDFSCTTIRAWKVIERKEIT